MFGNRDHMTLHAWWIFVGATFLISAMPGPNMLHVMGQSVRHGFGRALFAMAGCMLGLFLLFGLSAMGMSALLAALPGLFDGIRLIGALYLIWTGIKAWRDRSPPVAFDAESGDGPPRASTRLFRDGLLISVSNPKALLVAAAFFPQFVDPALSKAPQFAIMLASFTVIETSWYMIYATGGRTLAPLLRRAAWQRIFNKASGALFIFFGLSLLAWRPG